MAQSPMLTFSAMVKVETIASRDIVLGDNARAEAKYQRLSPTNNSSCILEAATPRCGKKGLSLCAVTVHIIVDTSARAIFVYSCRSRLKPAEGRARVSDFDTTGYIRRMDERVGYHSCR